MDDNERDRKIRFVFDSLDKGTFNPRPEDLTEYHQFENLLINQQNELIDKLYAYAKREFQYCNTAFCMFDILGYSNTISQDDSNLLNIYENIVLPLVDYGIKDGKFASEFMKIVPGIVDRKLGINSNERKKAPKIELLVFADSIILYVILDKETHPIFEFSPVYQIDLLTWAAKYIFTRMLNHEVLLRGSMGFGECLITKRPIAYLGNTIIEVHTVEAIQQWGGLTYAPSAERLIRKSKGNHHGIVNYKTPFKNDEKSKRLQAKYFGDSQTNYVLDWTLLVDLDIGEIAWIKRESENKNLTKNIRKLYQNTLDFYEAQSKPRKNILKEIYHK